MPEEARRASTDKEDGMIFDSTQTEAITEPGQATTVRSPHGVQPILTQDFVNALAISEAGEAMIFEQGKHGGGMTSWHVVGGYVENGEDPMTAVKRSLLESAGYGSDEWLYLGSYMMSETDQQIGVGHFFCARDAQPIGEPVENVPEALKLRWVSPRDLRYALLDGRISMLSYAITISMSLLTVLD